MNKKGSQVLKVELKKGVSLLNFIICYVELQLLMKILTIISGAPAESRWMEFIQICHVVDFFQNKQ